jgi:hypothetical protein
MIPVDLVPSSRVRPDLVPTTSSLSSPPYRGDEPGDGNQNCRPRPGTNPATTSAPNGVPADRKTAGADRHGTAPKADQDGANPSCRQVPSPHPTSHHDTLRFAYHGHPEPRHDTPLTASRHRSDQTLTSQPKLQRQQQPSGTRLQPPIGGSAG